MEFWDIYDRDGNLTGRTLPRSDRIPPGAYHLGVSLWIANSKGELLIQKRAEGKRIGPGLWSITGGAALAGETSAAGCVREVREELGIALDISEIDFLIRVLGEDILYDDYILIRDIPLASLALQKAEVAAARYVSIKEARSLFREGNFMLGDAGVFDRVERYLNQRNIHTD